MALIIAFTACLALVSLGASTYLAAMERSQELRRALYGRGAGVPRSLRREDLLTWLSETVRNLAMRQNGTGNGGSGNEEANGELAELVRQAGYPFGWSAQEFAWLRQVGLFCGVAVAVLAVVKNNTGLVAAGLVLAGLSMQGVDRYLRMRIAARKAALQKQIPDFADTVASITAVGLPLSVALERTAAALPAPLGDELERTVDAIRNGETVSAALVEMAKRVGTEDMKHLVEAMVEALRSGGEGLSRTMMEQGELYRNLYLQAQKERVGGLKGKMIWILVLAAAPALALMGSVAMSNFRNLLSF